MKSVSRDDYLVANPNDDTRRNDDEFILLPHAYYHEQDSPVCAAATRLHSSPAIEQADLDLRDTVTNNFGEQVGDCYHDLVEIQPLDSKYDDNLEANTMDGSRLHGFEIREDDFMPIGQYQVWRSCLDVQI